MAIHKTSFLNKFEELIFIKLSNFQVFEVFFFSFFLSFSIYSFS